MRKKGMKVSDSVYCLPLQCLCCETHGHQNIRNLDVTYLSTFDFTRHIYVPTHVMHVYANWYSCL